MKDYVELKIQIKCLDENDCVRTSGYFTSDGLAEDDVVDWFDKGGFSK